MHTFVLNRARSSSILPARYGRYGRAYSYGPSVDPNTPEVDASAGAIYQDPTVRLRAGLE